MSFRNTLIAMFVFLILVVARFSPRFSAASSADFGYSIVDGEVFWAGMQVAGADPGTFEWLEIDGRKLPWGRDSQRGYFRNLPVHNSDGPSFEAFLEDESLAKDKNHVYRGQRNTERTQWFSTGEKEWRKSMRQAARSVKVIPEADAATFRYRDNDLWVDKDHVFRRGKLVELADPSTYRELPIVWGGHGGYAADKTHVYRNGRVIEHADPKSFRLDSKTGLLMDDNFVFYGTQRFEACIDGRVVPAKSSTWREIGNGGYCTDGEYVYLSYGSVLLGANPDTFEVMSGGYSRDDDQVWYEDRAHPDADPLSFVALNRKVAKDLSHVWYMQRIVANVDPATLQVRPDGTLFDKSGPVVIGYHGRR